MEIGVAVRAQLDRVLGRLRQDLGFETLLLARLAGGERRIEALFVIDGSRTDLHVGHICAVGACDVFRATSFDPVDTLSAGAHKPIPASDDGVVAVPVTLSDQRLFGMLGGRVGAPDEATRIGRELQGRAPLACVGLDLLVAEDTRKQAVRGLVRSVIREAAFQPVFQPVADLESGQDFYLEGLTRLDATVGYTVPDLLSLARRVGMGAELELAFIRSVLAASESRFGHVPVAVNLSEETLLSDRLAPEIAHVQPERVIFELTEHAPVRDYPALREKVAQYRAQGIRIAIDDTGAGYTTLRHILDLKPDILKLDLAMAARVDTDAEALALIRFLQAYGYATGTALVVEGIERDAQVEALLAVGVRYAQGFRIGRPERSQMSG